MGLWENHGGFQISMHLINLSFTPGGGGGLAFGGRGQGACLGKGSALSGEVGLGRSSGGTGGISVGLLAWDACSVEAKDGDPCLASSLRMLPLKTLGVGLGVGREACWRWYLRLNFLFFLTNRFTLTLFRIMAMRFCLLSQYMMIYIIFESRNLIEQGNMGLMAFIEQKCLCSQ